MGGFWVIAVGACVLVTGFFVLRYRDRRADAQRRSHCLAVWEITGDIIDSYDDDLDDDPNPLLCQITLDEMGSVSSGKERFAHYAFQAGEPFPMSDIAYVRDGELYWRLPGRGWHSRRFCFVPAAVAPQIVATLNNAFGCPIAPRGENIRRTEEALRGLPNLDVSFAVTDTGLEYSGENLGGHDLYPKAFINRRRFGDRD